MRNDLYSQGKTEYSMDCVPDNEIYLKDTINKKKGGRGDVVFSVYGIIIALQSLKQVVQWA